MRERGRERRGERGRGGERGIERERKRICQLIRYEPPETDNVSSGFSHFAADPAYLFVVLGD